MTSVAIAEAQPDILRALRSLGGRGTLGDVVSSVGLPRDQVEGALKSLLESHQGHLEVSESGEVIYLFDPKLIRRDRVPLLQRIKSAAKRFLTGAFKAWIVAMLVVYFVVFVVLVIAAIAAMMSRGGDRRSGGGWGRTGRHHGHFHFPSFWLWYYIWTPRWRLGSPYYGRRWEATLERDSRPPFYKKVFAFVFGPDRPKPTRKQLDRSTLRLIRARRGALTTAELMEHTALGMPEAEEEMARLLGSYAGEPAVSPNGELVYTFPELMTSAHGRVETREPNPAWMRMEYPLELTGNEKKHDAIIAGMNGFTLVAGATAPWFIFPQLGIAGTAAFVGLVVVPVVFSVLFFTVPLLRVLGVRKENRAREARNVRRLVLGLVYREALSGGGSISVEEATAHVRSRMKDQSIDPSVVESALHQLAAEFDADVSTGPAGQSASGGTAAGGAAGAGDASTADPWAPGAESLRFSFPAIRQQFLASEAMRQRLKLEDAELGDIVYSSAESDEEAAERQLAAFDRELADADLTAYLPSPNRTGFEDEFEIVAFEEELKRRATKI